VIMKKALWKNLIREIRNSRTRYLSILGIAMIGVAFFAGIRATGPDMKRSGDAYFDRTSMFDLLVASDEGLVAEDIEAIRSASGVARVEPGLIQDALLDYGGDQSAVVKLYSMPIEEEAPGLSERPATFQQSDYGISGETSGWLNTPHVVSGRLPADDQECALDLDFAKEQSIGIGDEIAVSNYGSSRRLVICGLIQSPLYIYIDRGSSTLGSGENDGFAYVSGNVVQALGPRLPFGADLERRYSVAYIMLGHAADLNAFLPEYESAVHVVKDRLKQLDPEEDWYVLDRKEANTGYSGYQDDTNRIEAIGTVFPLIFFLVAVLVTLATMTRMVEEQRTQIGVLKALGYKSTDITRQFLIYAASASMLGSLFGAMLGFKLFPSVIFDAYGSIYSIPDFQTPFSWPLALIAGAAAVASVVFGTMAACGKELLTVPAELMRPKAPPMGKRILMERITPVWKRFSFIQKVTARNIFRYKKRFLMSIVGVAASCGLLLTGFGVRDSIFSIMDIEFTELLHYDMQCNFEESMPPQALQAAADSLLDPLLAVNPLACYYGNLDSQSEVSKASGSFKRAVTVIAANDPQGLERLFTLRSKAGSIPLPEEGAVISQKLAELMDAGPGDRFYLTKGKKEAEVRIEAVMENYLGHYVLMDARYYQQIFQEECRFNHLLFQLTPAGKADQAAVAASLLADERINMVKAASAIKETMGNTMDSLLVVIIVLILASAALLFVIMYNLTNINIEERRRELATLRVLGFTDEELYQYVYRENNLLTLLGIAAGLVIGLFMHRMVIVTCEIDNIKFVRQIQGLSYLYSGLLTMAFSLVVNRITRFQIRRINMVESLKSIE